MNNIIIAAAIVVAIVNKAIMNNILDILQNWKMLIRKIINTKKIKKNER